MEFLISVFTTTLVFFIAVPALLWLGKAFCLYVVVRERQAVVFELFGRVRAVISEPGLSSPLRSRAMTRSAEAIAFSRAAASAGGACAARARSPPA